jgi:hypothetical protein
MNKPKTNKDGILAVILIVGVIFTCGYMFYEFSQSIAGIKAFIYGVAKGVGF